MKKHSGITLVALVITIIVLLILAGVSISLTIGNNGVLSQASNAVIANKDAAAKEELAMAWAAATTKYWSEKTADSTKTLRDYLTKEELQKNLTGGTIVEGPIYTNGQYRVKYEKDGQIYTYTIDANNNVTNVTGNASTWDGTTVSEGLIGEGTEASPYLISSVPDLYYMSEKMSKWENITGLNPDRTANGCDVRANYSHYKLTTDLSLKGQEWLPIGVTRKEDGTFNSGTFYEGSFDGGNHEISDVTINYDSDYGFFLTFIKVTIKNLILTNIDFSGKGSIGGISGVSMTWNYTPVPQISNCYVSGKIRSTGFLDTTLDHYTMQSWCVGGLAAWTDGPVIIDNCTVDVDVFGHYYVGGLIGQAKSTCTTVDGVDVFGTRITNCTVNGKVTGNKEVAGFIGSGYGFSMNNCVSNADVETVDSPLYNSDSAQNFSGLVGQAEGKVWVENCRYTGNIRINKDITIVGPIAGVAYVGTFKNCTNTGNITCTQNVTSLGGILGYFNNGTNGLATGCSSSGNIIVDTTKNVRYSGRIVGTLGGVDAATFVFTNCTNTGTSNGITEDIGRRYTN